MKASAAVVVPSSKAQVSRKVLESLGVWDKRRKLQRQDAGMVAIPVSSSADMHILLHHLQQLDISASIRDSLLPPSRSQHLVTPGQRLRSASQVLLKQRCRLAGEWDRLLPEVPTHWERHGDLVLLPAMAYVSKEWRKLGQDLWQTVADCLEAKRVARKAIISADGFRSPQVELLVGDNSVVQHVDNSIRYEYDLTKCMFSAGNITEKLRIAKLDCRGETVVDMYAGIGYFALPYLVHAGASHVHACEWNPDAVTALRQNLQLNNVSERCTVHHGDNRQLTLKGLADRVNLGLIPSSEDGWPSACRFLKPQGGILHIHGNVNSCTAAGERLLSTQHDQADTQHIEVVGTHNSHRESCVPVSQCPSDMTLSPQNCSDVQSIKDDRTQTHCREISNGESRQLQSCRMTQLGDSEISQGQQHEEGMHGKDCLTNGGKRASQIPTILNPSQTAQDEENKRIVSCPKLSAWHKWGETACTRLTTLLEREWGGGWLVTVTHIELVKSYAPHVHHIVLDIHCTPLSSNSNHLI